VGQIYGFMQDVFDFVGSFKDFPPRSSPPSFEPGQHHGRLFESHQSNKMLEQQFPMLQQEAQKAAAAPATGGKKKK